ncbi:metal-dependent hydrolase [candidate division KSB1 bacterium]|nr:metal-dependent hydrolase [candidate division KSB1 bacterium]
MATPIGHALGGFIVYAAGQKRFFDIKLLTATVVFAVLPDIDFLFGFVVGKPNLYHHGFTHSFVFVICIGVAGAWLLTLKNRKQFRLYTLMFIGAGVSHLTFDLMTVDGTAPFGAPVLWPFTNKYFIFPVRIFMDVHRAADSARFFISLFNPHNLKTVVREILMLAPVFFFILLLNKRFQTRGK